MGDNPTENNHNKSCSETRRKLWLGASWMAIGGDTKAIYWGKINHLWRSTLLRKYELRWGRPKLCWGQGHAVGYLNQPTQLGDKERSSTEDQTLRRGTESTQTSRDTRRVNCLGNLWCFALKDLLSIKMLLIFLFNCFGKFLLLYVLRKRYFD